MDEFLNSINPFEGKHTFLAEELLQPRSCGCDSTRTNMFTGHISQTVVLNEPDIPLVFTNFENKFGSYTSAIKKSLSEDAVVYSVYEKNSKQNVIILYYPKLCYFDIHFAKSVKHLTETYGYLLKNDYAMSLKYNDVVPANSILQGWSCHDEYGNFQYGKNLRTLYASIEGLTYEDGIIISESAAKGIAHTSVEVVEININPNDILINCYGNTSSEYKSFPNTGEYIKNGILTACRRVHKDTLAKDLSVWELNKINYESDTIYYIEGQVIDIEVFSNLDLDLEKLGGESNTYSLQPQLYNLIVEHNKFQEYLLNVLEPIVKNTLGYTYSDEIGFWYNRVKSTFGKKWSREGKEFDGVILKFTVAKYSPAVEGSKITNRYGGKGVISTIVPDHLMPYCEDDPSEVADVVINCLSVNNRLNISQLWESELNFLSYEIVKKLKTLNLDIPVCESIIHNFLTIVNPTQAEHFINLESNIKNEFIKSILDFGYIPLHQPPFYGVISLENLYKCYKEFDIKPYSIAGVEERMIMGNNYYLKLRHEPRGKFSARSAGSTSMSGVPTKKAQLVRSRTQPYSVTPIRIGDQECNNMLLANQHEELKRFFRMYSTDSDAREYAIKELLTRDNVENGARIEIPKENRSRPVAGFKALLEYIGIAVVNE